MIYAKSVTYGLDSKIKKMQTALQDYLPWFNEDGVSDTDIAIYGKLYRNPDPENRMIPEAYKSDTEYSQVFVDDKIGATIGFLPIPNRSISDNKYLQNIDIICTINLTKIYGANERYDELALQQFINALNQDNSIHELIEVKEGITNVFGEFYNENIKFNNMQPWYVFSVTAAIEYVNDYCPSVSVIDVTA
jgi:hypothetical protein